MPDVDAFTRPYLFVDVHSAATGDAVADLLERGAAALRRHGEVDIQHVAFDIADGVHATSVSLTVYYDRVERRRHARPEALPSHTAARHAAVLRSMD